MLHALSVRITAKIFIFFLLAGWMGGYIVRFPGEAEVFENAAKAAYQPASRGSATYYVDPARGSNESSGASPSEAWRNPPGTRTADNRGFYGDHWGAITFQDKIICGDVVLLKGGSIQTAEKGGAWRIDSGENGNGAGFYTPDCPAEKPITLRVATAQEWPESSGPFTLDGNGVAPSCLFGCGYTHGLVHIQDIDSFVLAGAGPDQRLIVRNSQSSRAVAHNLMLTSSRPPPNATARFIGQWLELIGASGDGAGIGPAQQFIIRDTVSHDNKGSGFSTGNLNDNRIVNGGFQDVEAYANGPKNGGSIGDQFLFLGCESCYLIGAKSHGAYLRGLNFGAIGAFDGTDMFLLIRRGEFWDNGRTNDSKNVSQTGVCWSGNDLPNGRIQRGIMEQTIIYRNREGGGPCAYGQGWAEVWNSVWWGNGWDKSVGGEGDILASGGDFKRLGIYNSILQKRPSDISWSGSGPSNFNAKKCPISDHNLYHPVMSDTEVLSDFDCTESDTFHPQTRTYADPPRFLGADDRIGVEYDPGFIRSDDFDYKNTDFHLTPSSSAKDAGTYFFRTKYAGTGNAVQVAGIGGSDDPRHYFLAPESYYHAQPDIIQIKGASCANAENDFGSPERARIAALAPNLITLDRTCAWQSGAGVHLPWHGKAPDMGAFEFGESEKTSSSPASAFFSSSLSRTAPPPVSMASPPPPAIAIPPAPRLLEVFEKFFFSAFNKIGNFFLP